MSRLKRDVQLTLLSRIPVMLLSFLSVVFLTRLLGPEGNGVYTFTLAVLNLFFTVIGFQLESTLPVFLARDKENKPSIFSAVSLLAVVSMITFAILLCVIVFFIPGGDQWVIPHGQPVVFFFLFLLIAFILRRISTLIQASLRGAFLFKSFNIYMLLNQLMPSLVYGSLLLFSVFGTDHIPVITCFKIILLLETSIVLIGWLILRRNNLVSFSTDFKAYLRPVSSLSAKSLLSASGHFLNKRLDVWFVQFYRGTASLGQYGLATQITNFVSDAMSPFNQVLVPHIAEATPEQHSEIVERTARLNMAIAFSAAVLIAGTSWFFIPLFFGRSFAEAIPATQVLAIGIIFISQRLVFTGYFKAINQMMFPVRAAWAGVIITILFDIALIPEWGILGASWATTLAYGTSSFYLVMKARQKLGFNLLDILLLRPSDIKWLFSKTKKELSN